MGAEGRELDVGLAELGASVDTTGPIVGVMLGARGDALGESVGDEVVGRLLFVGSEDGWLDGRVVISLVGDEDGFVIG